MGHSSSLQNGTTGHPQKWLSVETTLRENKQTLLPSSKSSPTERLVGLGEGGLTELKPTGCRENGPRKRLTPGLCFQIQVYSSGVGLQRGGSEPELVTMLVIFEEIWQRQEE